MLVKTITGVFGFNKDHARPVIRSGELADKAISVEIQNQSGISLGVYIVKVGDPLPALEDEMTFQLVADPTQLQTWLVDKGNELVFVPAVDNLTAHGVSEVIVALKEATSGTGQNTGGGGGTGGGGEGGGEGGGGGGDDHFGGGTGPIEDRPIITKQPELAHMNGMVTISCDYIKGDSIIWYSRDLMHPTNGWVVASDIEGWNTKTITFDPNKRDYLEFHAIVSNVKNATANTNGIKVMIAPRLMVDKLSATIVPNVDGTFVFKVQNANASVPRITTETGVPVDVATIDKTVLGSTSVSYTVKIPYNDSTNGKTYLFTVEYNGQIQSVQISLPWMMKIISADVSAPDNSALRLELQTGENAPKRIRWINVRKDGTRISVLTTATSAVKILNFPINNVSYWIQGEIEVDGFGVIDKTRIFDLNDIVVPDIGKATVATLDPQQGQQFTLEGVIGSPITFRRVPDGKKIDDIYNTTLGGKVTLDLKPIDGRVENDDLIDAHYEVEGQQALQAGSPTWKYYEYPKIGLMQFPNIGVTRLVISAIGYFETMSVRCGDVIQNYTNKNTDIYNIDITRPVKDTPIVINTKNGIKHARITDTLLTRPKVSYVTNITQDVTNNTITCQVHNQTDNTPIISYKWYLAKDPTHTLTTNAECSIPVDHSGEIIVCETEIGVAGNVSMATHKLSDLDGAYFIRNLYMVRDISTPETVELKWQADKYTTATLKRCDPKVTPETWTDVAAFPIAQKVTSYTLTLDQNEDCKYQISLDSPTSDAIVLSSLVIINEKGGISWGKTSGLVFSTTDIYNWQSNNMNYRTQFGMGYAIDDLQNAKSVEYDLLPTNGNETTTDVLGGSNQGSITINGVPTGNAALSGTVFTAWNVQSIVTIQPAYALADIAWTIPVFLSNYSTPVYLDKIQQVIYGRGGEVNRLDMPVHLAQITPLLPHPVAPGLVIKLQAQCTAGKENITEIYWQTATDLIGTKGWSDRKDITTLDADLPYSDDNKNLFYRPVVKTKSLTYYGYPLAIFDNTDYPVLPHKVPNMLTAYGDLDTVSFISNIGTSTHPDKREQEFKDTKFYWSLGFEICDPNIDVATSVATLYGPEVPTWVRNPSQIIAVTDTPDLLMSRKEWAETLSKKSTALTASNLIAGNPLESADYLFLTAQCGSRWFTLATVHVSHVELNQLTYIVTPIPNDEVATLTFDIGSASDVTEQAPAYRLKLAWYNNKTKFSVPVDPVEINKLYDKYSLVGLSSSAPSVSRGDGEVHRDVIVASSAYKSVASSYELHIQSSYRETGNGVTDYIAGYWPGKPDVYSDVLMAERTDAFTIAVDSYGETDGVPNPYSGSYNSAQDFQGILSSRAYSGTEGLVGYAESKGYCGIGAYQLVNTDHDWESDIFVTKLNSPAIFDRQRMSSKDGIDCVIPFQLRCNTWPVGRTAENVSSTSASFPYLANHRLVKIRENWLSGWNIRRWCFDEIAKEWKCGEMRYKNQLSSGLTYAATGNPMVTQTNYLGMSTQLRGDTIPWPGLDDRRIVMTTNAPIVMDISAKSLANKSIMLTVNPRKDTTPVTFRSEIIDTRSQAKPSILADTEISTDAITLSTSGIVVEPGAKVFDVIVRYCVKTDVGWSQWLTKKIAILPAVITEPPVITTQPIDLKSARSGAFKCNIIADGNGGHLTYRWMINEHHIDGDATCLITSEMLQDEVKFPNDMTGYCDVNNGFKTVRSNVFTLTVDPELPPTITKQPNSLLILDRTATPPPITVDGHGDDPTTYKWYMHSTGDSAARLYKETPTGVLALLPSDLAVHAWFKTGLSTWYVDVVDKDGATSSDDFTINIIQPPVATPTKVNYDVSAITPADMEVNIGNTNGAIVYKWETTFKDGTVKVWADEVSKTCTLTLAQLNAVVFEGECTTTCTVTNEAGTVTSVPITIARIQVPTFITQPDAEYVMTRTGSLVISIAATDITDHTQVVYHIHNQTMTSANIGSVELTAAMVASWPAKVTGTIVLTNDTGTVTSNEFSISILAPLEITSPILPIIIRDNSTNSAALSVTVDDQLHECSYNWYGKNGEHQDTYDADGTSTLIFTPEQLQTLPTLSGSDANEPVTHVACEITRKIDSARVMALGVVTCDYHQLPTFTTQPVSAVVPDRNGTLPTLTCAISAEPNMETVEYDWMYEVAGKEKVLAITKIPSLTLTGLLSAFPDGATTCRVKIVHKQMIEAISDDFTITIQGDAPVITTPPNNITIDNRDVNSPEIKFEVSGSYRDYQFQWFVKTADADVALKYTHEPSLILTPHDMARNEIFPLGEVTMYCKCTRRDGGKVTTPTFIVTFTTARLPNSRPTTASGNICLVSSAEGDGTNFELSVINRTISFDKYVAGANVSCVLDDDTELYAAVMTDTGNGGLITIPTHVTLESALTLSGIGINKQFTLAFTAPDCATESIGQHTVRIIGKPALVNTKPSDLTIANRSVAETPITGITHNDWYNAPGITTKATLVTVTSDKSQHRVDLGGVWNPIITPAELGDTSLLPDGTTPCTVSYESDIKVGGETVSHFSETTESFNVTVLNPLAPTVVTMPAASVTVDLAAPANVSVEFKVDGKDLPVTYQWYMQRTGLATGNDESFIEYPLAGGESSPLVITKENLKDASVFPVGATVNFYCSAYTDQGSLSSSVGQVVITDTTK